MAAPRNTRSRPTPLLDVLAEALSLRGVPRARAVAAERARHERCYVVQVVSRALGRTARHDSAELALRDARGAELAIAMQLDEGAEVIVRPEARGVLGAELHHVRFERARGGGLVRVDVLGRGGAS
jgi:hypothetical protein